MAKTQVPRETTAIADETEAGPNLVAKLVAAAKAIKAIERTGHNERFNYAFFEEAEVVSAVREALYEQGVFLLMSADWVEQSQVITPTANGQRAHTHTTVKVIMTFTDGSEHLGFSWYGEADDSGDKGINKAVVAAVKYALLKNFLIPKAGDDTELDENAPVPTPANAPPAPKPAPTKRTPPPTAPPGAPASPVPAENRTGATSKGGGREAAYSAARGHGLKVDSTVLRGLASEALNRRVTTLYQLSEDDWNALAIYIEDNFNEDGSKKYAELDADLPF